VLKRMLILVALLLVTFQASGWAQEREPLAMRITFEWTTLGTVAGALVGAALWLTDPGNPQFTLGRSMIEGSAWGAVGGMGFGIFVMQSALIPPSGFAYAPTELAPSQRLTDDPVAAQVQAADPLASAAVASTAAPPTGASTGGFAINLPLFKMRF